MTHLKIDLHDGTHLETDVENFDADALADLINDNTLIVVAIGHTVVNRNMVRAVYEVTPA